MLCILGIQDIRVIAKREVQMVRIQAQSRYPEISQALLKVLQGETRRSHSKKGS